MIRKKNTTRIWSFVFAVLLVLSCFQGVIAVNFKMDSDNDSNNILYTAPVNPEYLTYQENQQNVWTFPAEPPLQSLGFIPETVDLKHIKGKKIPKKDFETIVAVVGTETTPAVTVGEATTPTSFDLRVTGQVSPVKNQGSCGSCWAFASYGSLESTNLPIELWDFSENNLINTAGFDYAPCAGGSHMMATAYLARWSGPVLESEDPYGSISPTGLSPHTFVDDILFLPDRNNATDNDNIKIALQNMGAVYTTMRWSALSYNSINATYYYRSTGSVNHAVTIVGWDDNFDKSRFYLTPPGNGAFIVKNSWGTSFGQSGYFYVSYYDTTIGQYNAVFTSEAIDAYDTIYQYDPLGWVTSTGYYSDTAWFANVFTAKADEYITTVAFYTPQLDTEYQISVYLDPDLIPLSSSGPALLTQGTLAIPGYHTVTLPGAVRISPGQKFSIVVQLRTPSYEYPISVENPYNGYASKATANLGESYVSRDGKSWTDLVKSMPNTNVCLKAFTTQSNRTAPTASFTASITNGTAPFTVQFTDTSAHFPTSWKWTFGDGMTSTLQNPSHQYTSIGTYTVSLTATNGEGSNTLIRENYISITIPVTKADFTATPTSGTVPLTVQYTDKSTSNPTSWAWNFGDGTTSYLQHPAHQYTSAGTYTVSLAVTNLAGSNSTTKVDYINVTAPVYPPVPNFIATPTSGSAPLTVQFTDISTNNPTAWLWTFGDGTTSSLQHPSHEYTGAGIYTVTLTTTNTGGSDMIARFSYIEVTTPIEPIIVDFSSNSRSGPAPLSIQFWDRSSGSPRAWQWDFGDGMRSSLQSPSHEYTNPGMYTVTLTATNEKTGGEKVKKFYIKVSKPKTSGNSIVNENNKNFIQIS